MFQAEGDHNPDSSQGGKGGQRSTANIPDSSQGAKEGQPSTTNIPDSSQGAKGGQRSTANIVPGFRALQMTIAFLVTHLVLKRMR